MHKLLAPHLYIGCQGRHISGKVILTDGQRLSTTLRETIVPKQQATVNDTSCVCQHNYYITIHDIRTLENTYEADVI